MSSPSGDVPQWGGNGGVEFRAYPSKNSTVRKIVVYCGTEPGTSASYVVRGLHLHWWDDEEEIHGQTTDDAHGHVFEDPDERIKDMTIRAGRLVDQLTFNTNNGGPYGGGGSGGDPHPVGKGLIKGAIGREGTCIDKLGIALGE